MQWDTLGDQENIDLITPNTERLKKNGTHTKISFLREKIMPTKDA